MKDRDITILKRIVQYADEINGTIIRFDLDIDKLKSDYVFKNAIAMCLLQIGELVVNLSDEFKSEYDKMPWRDIISVRNRAAHTYFSIDMEILWGIAIQDIPDLKDYCADIIDRVNDENSEIEIRRLTPDLAEDYAHFFDVTPHDDHTIKDELPCYCITWRNDETYLGNDHWYPTREERRDRAISFVMDAKLQGYLAYQGDTIVGWSNATADCQKGVDYLRAFWPIEEYRTDIKVKSIFCFVIAPEMQRKGIATQLVEYICKDAANDGFDFVEAYVNKEFTDNAHELRGPLTMYVKLGFCISAEREGKVVMRKSLK